MRIWTCINAGTLYFLLVKGTVFVPSILLHLKKAQSDEATINQVTIRAAHIL